MTSDEEERVKERCQHDITRKKLTIEVNDCLSDSGNVSEPTEIESGPSIGRHI